jgi:hypothetical protein
MDVLQIAVIGGLLIVSFVIGANVGMSVAKGESVKMPDLNPINTIKEHSEKKQADKKQRQEQERKDAIMYNINVYDGTSVGQREVPKG